MSTKTPKRLKTDAELPGLYPANIRGYSDTSLYPDTAESVLVAPGYDGYHDVFLIDGEGSIVATGNRSRRRIESALDGDEGYDIFVYDDA